MELAKVLDLGAKKYGKGNWKNGFNWSRLYGAAQRHLHQWYSGETFDTESGLNHLSHALCNLVFLIEFSRSHPELDDRQPLEENNVYSPIPKLEAPEQILDLVPRPTYFLNQPVYKGTDK